VPHLLQSGRGQEDDEGHELGAVAEDLQRLRGRVEDASPTLVDDGADGVELGAVEVSVVLAVLQELVVLDAPFHVLAIHEPVAEAVVLL